MIADRYQLDREIGRGGSGAVHLARDTVLGRDVAIKRIGYMPGADSPDLARAEREARLAASLDHPNVVTVLDLVEEQGSQWLVMEYVEGSTLAQIVREEGPLEAVRAAVLLGQAAAALVEAHAAGIVHRDVKPSNLLVTSGDVAKLADFGIARSSSDASLTQTGLVTGSPAYLAPEVASGASATPASDVWSLGATLFHTVTGGPPYDVGDNLVGALYRIVHEEPPRLPADHPLAAIVAHTMVRDPASRWSTGRVKGELDNAARGLPVIVATEAFWDGGGTQDHTAVLQTTGHLHGERHTTTRAVVAGLAAAALVAVGVVAWRAGYDSRDPAPVDAQTQQSEPTSPTASTVAQGPTAEAMDAFIANYLEAVTTDRKAAFAMLSPQFQEASGGFGGYTSWWATVDEATLTDIESNPDDLTVAYTVRYAMKSGKETTEDVRLRLTQVGESLLIAGEQR